MFSTDYSIYQRRACENFDIISHRSISDSFLNKKPLYYGGFFVFIHFDNARSGTKYILYPIIFDRVPENDKI